MTFLERHHMELIKYFRLKRNDEAAKILCKISNDIQGEYVLFEMQKARLVEAMTRRNNALRAYLKNKFKFTLLSNQIVMFDDQEKEIRVYEKIDGQEPEIKL